MLKSFRAYGNIAVDVARVVVGHVFDEAVIERYAVGIFDSGKFSVAAVKHACGNVGYIALGVVGDYNEAVVCAGDIKTFYYAVIECCYVTAAVVDCF